MFYKAESRPIIRNPRKTKITLTSKVKITHGFVKHLSTKMCCKPASFLSRLNYTTGALTKKFNLIKHFW